MKERGRGEVYYLVRGRERGKGREREGEREGERIGEGGRGGGEKIAASEQSN